MNNDIRLSTGFFHHPKTVKLQRRIGAGGLVALLQLWTWAAQNRPDGSLSGMDGEDIAIAAGWTDSTETLIGALVDMRFLDGAEGSYSLHGWQEHQAYAAAEPARVEKAKKAARARWSKHDAPSNAPSMPEHAPSNAQDMLKHDLAMPQTKPNQTKPSKEIHTPLPPSQGGGVCASPAPLSGEELAEAREDVQAERRRGDYEFSLLRSEYDKARQEGPMAGRQEFLQLFGSPGFPGLDEILAGLQRLLEKDDQFRRGYAPGLARFLRERMWTMQPRAPAGEGQGETPEEEQARREYQKRKREYLDGLKARKQGRKQ